jgi:excisionase family DNA binding protein
MQSILIREVTVMEFEEMISRSVAREFKKQATNPFDASAEQTNATDELLTKKEAAKYLRVSTVTLNKYLRQGFVKGHTIAGTRVRFKQNELKKALRILYNKI